MLSIGVCGMWIFIPKPLIGLSVPSAGYFLYRMSNYFHIAHFVYFCRALLFGGAGDSKASLLLLMGSVLLWG